MDGDSFIHENEYNILASSSEIEHENLRSDILIRESSRGQGVSGVAKEAFVG